MTHFSAQRFVASILFVFVLWGSGLAPCSAQVPDSSLVAKFQVADSYFRAGQFDRAISLLEDLYEASPNTHAFYNRLQQAYENVKRYDDAIALVDERLENQTSPTLIAEKARLLYLKGDEQAARTTWNEAIAAAPDNRNTYRLVYHSMTQIRLFEQAIDVLEQGRTALGAPELYQTELAYLYNLDGQHGKAMEEYLALLADDERKLNFVRNRLNRFLDQEGALSSSIVAVERAVREAPMNIAYRELLATLYLEAERYRQALDANRAIDRLEQEEGRVLYTFARKAADAGAYDVALEAFEEILSRHPDAPVAAEAQFGIAEMHERWAEQQHERAYDHRGNRVSATHYEAALDTYRSFLQTHPSHELQPEALRRIGRLQQDVFFDLGEAKATMNEVMTRYPESAAADAASYDLGRIELLQGKLEDARFHFSRLVERLRIGELAEQARYDLALIHFYRGEFESARTLVSAIDENTSTDVANDAIELKVLLNENKGPDSLNTPLRAYAEARLLHRQRRPSQAIDTLEVLLQRHGQHPIADEARFLRAEALRDTGRAKDAATAFGEIPLIHPKSPLADRSLFQAAEIQELELGDTDAALQSYTRILTEYPGSLLLPDVRARIRALRDDGA